MQQQDLYIGFIIKNSKDYIKNKKDFSFLKKNKSPFYNIKTGKVSGYNEVVLLAYLKQRSMR